MSQLLLIVDDDADFRAELRSMLEGRGYLVVEAPNGRKALHYLTSDAPQPDLILMDLRMPEMTGWELSALLQVYKRMSTIPVVLMSALDSFLRYSSKVPFVPKPIDPTLLFSTIDVALALSATAKAKVTDPVEP